MAISNFFLSKKTFFSRAAYGYDVLGHSLFSQQGNEKQHDCRKQEDLGHDRGYVQTVNT
jgi:hypothetical protein